jgi:hypothetical protein
MNSKYFPKIIGDPDYDVIINVMDLYLTGKRLVFGGKTSSPNIVGSSR